LDLWPKSLVWASSAANLRCHQAAQEHGEHKIKNAQKAHDSALRFVRRFDLSEQEAWRINQRITHLKTLLAELR